MLRRALALALLALPAFPQGESDDEVTSGDNYVFALEGRIARGERDAPAVFVRLADAGVLQVKAGDAWQDVTLAGLSSFLETARDEDHEAQRRIGKSGFEEFPGGGKGSRLFVSIDVEPSVPWQHVQWVVTVVAEQKYGKLELHEGKRALLVVLPQDRSIHLDGEPPPVLKASVHVLARNEQAAKWGDVEIARPVGVSYRCGDSETGDLAGVTDHLRKARKAAEETKDRSALFYGEFKAGAKAPYGKVFDVMEAFVAAEIPSLDTFETFVSIPPRAVREAKRLPYPEVKRPRTERLPEPAGDDDTED